MCMNKIGCQKAIWNDRWKGLTKFTSQEINKGGHCVRVPAYVLWVAELFLLPSPRPIFNYCTVNMFLFNS